MTADPPGAHDDVLDARLDALDGDPTAEHLAVYTAIASELAARLDQTNDDSRAPDERATHVHADEHGGARG